MAWPLTAYLNVISVDPSDIYDDASDFQHEVEENIWIDVFEFGWDGNFKQKRVALFIQGKCMSNSDELTRFLEYPVALATAVAFGGHLCLLEYIVDNHDVCTTSAMDNAAENGHFDVVKWLHENRAEGCTTRAMDGAAYRGDFNMIKYLHENRLEG
ncbi:ankyrin repeat [Thraustotheca clavata]|uniref:Ankyrin repeat n=1 Tax=Thraustotheca clavata TaxID=74557 RepID=A0A1V9ZLA6_9STRA|nr:ankyrin repeat [Thraustotheca clavata]